MHWSAEDSCKWFACQSCMPFDPFHMIHKKISSAWLTNLKRNCQNDKIQSAKIGTRSKKNELRVVLTYRWVPNNCNQFAQSWIFQSFLHRQKKQQKQGREKERNKNNKWKQTGWSHDYNFSRFVNKMDVWSLYKWRRNNKLKSKCHVAIDWKSHRIAHTNQFLLAEN